MSTTTAPAGTTSTTSGPEWLCSDLVGRLVVLEGMVYYLTACCGASATGISEGVACRACYRPVSYELGRVWLASDESSWVAYGERLRADLGEFTDRMVERVSARARSLSV